MHADRVFLTILYLNINLIDAAHVTSFIDDSRICHPVYATIGNLGDQANEEANRETIALLPIFDETRHPRASAVQLRELSKILFLECMRVRPFNLKFPG